jgi:hypothetical protein
MSATAPCACGKLVCGAPPCETPRGQRSTSHGEGRHRELHGTPITATAGYATRPHQARSEPAMQYIRLSSRASSSPALAANTSGARASTPRPASASFERASGSSFPAIPYRALCERLCLAREDAPQALDAASRASWRSRLCHEMSDLGDASFWRCNLAGSLT